MADHFRVSLMTATTNGDNDMGPYDSEYMLADHVFDVRFGDLDAGDPGSPDDDFYGGWEE